MRRIPILLALLLALLCGCASESTKTRTLDAVLYAYAGEIRWGEFDRAWLRLDPEVRESSPLTDLEWARFEQIQVTGYRVQSSAPVDDTHLEQVVQISLINRHTQAERSVVAREVWRWDEETERWWLMSGFPNIAGSN